MIQLLQNCMITSLANGANFDENCFLWAVYYLVARYEKNSKFVIIFPVLYFLQKIFPHFSPSLGWLLLHSIRHFKIGGDLIFTNKFFSQNVNPSWNLSPSAIVRPIVQGRNWCIEQESKQERNRCITAPLSFSTQPPWSNFGRFFPDNGNSTLVID